MFLTHAPSPCCLHLSVNVPHIKTPILMFSCPKLPLHILLCLRNIHQLACSPLSSFTLEEATVTNQHILLLTPSRDRERKEEGESEGSSSFTKHSSILPAATFNNAFTLLREGTHFTLV